VFREEKSYKFLPKFDGLKIMLGGTRLFLHGWVSKSDNIIWMEIGYLMHTTCFILDQIINIGLHIENKVKIWNEFTPLETRIPNFTSYESMWELFTFVQVC
jgi:hypothetical protein